MAQKLEIKGKFNNLKIKWNHQYCPLTYMKDVGLQDQGKWFHKKYIALHIYLFLIGIYYVGEGFEIVISDLNNLHTDL